jgi:excisionase family DNA binding protein
MTAPVPESFSVIQAAAQLGVSRGWLYQRCQRHEIAHQKYGRTVRFTAEQIEAARAQYAQPVIQTLHHLIPGRKAS